MAQLSTTNTQFALDLYRTLRETSTSGNVFFSPMSITSALAMVYLGAKGNTAAQMAKVLYLNTKTDIHTDVQRFLSDINRPAAPYLLKVANRLYGEKTYSFLQEFLESTQKFYQADLVPLDFIGASEESRNQMNQWVEAQTEGKIREILKPGTVNPTSRLVLVNAVYFKGKWLNQFLGHDTREGLFKISQTETKPVQMMYQQAKFPFSYIPEYSLQVLELPYIGEELSMFILLPEEASDGSDPLDELERKLTMEKMHEWTDRKNMDTIMIDLSLPKFKLEDDYELKGPLAHLGMTDVFEVESDLSGMNGKGDLFISTAVHKTFIKVDEEGTEAAAATGVGIQLCCLIIGKPFIADHPFLFFIRHNKSKTILFLGRFSSP